MTTYDRNDPGTYLRAALAALDQNAVRNVKQPAAGDIDQARAWIQTALSLLPAPAAAPQPPTVPALRIGAPVRVKCHERAGERGVIVSEDRGLFVVRFPDMSTGRFTADELTVLE